MKRLLLALCLLGTYGAVHAVPENNTIVTTMTKEAKKGGCLATKGSEKFIKGSTPELGEVVVASMNFEGCGGGNNWGTTVQVFYNGGNTNSIVLPNVERMTVREGKLVIDSLELGDDDPRCCPSQKTRTLYKISKGKLTDVTVKKPTNIY